MKLNKRSAWRGAIPATPLRRNVGLTYIAAYVAVLLSCTRIWSADPTLLYVGRDADFSIWLASAYLDWARPFGVTALNPFQGMGSMLMPMNPHFNPGAWIFQSDLGLSTKFVVSMAVYFVEVTVSCFVLGITLGFSRAFSFAAALWLVVLFLPPFNFVFGLQGIVATSPQWANTLALCNLILTLFILIGNHNWSARGLAYSCAINAALATGVVVLALVCLLTAPFYGAATMSGLVLLCAVVLLASSSAWQAFWRVAAGLYAVAICYALGILEFFAASKSLTARFAKGGSDEISLPQIHWPTEFSSATLVSAQDWLCQAAVVCGGPLWFPGALTGGYWLHVAIIAGAIAVWVRMSRPLSSVGGWFALLWAGLLIFWLCCGLGIVTDVAISPIYVIVAMHPFWSFFSLFSLCLLVRCIARSVLLVAPPTVVNRPIPAWTSPFVLPVAVTAFSLIMALQYGDFLARQAPAVWYFPQRGAFDMRRSSAIVDRLRQEIALRPGQPFRGSVATILGAKGGSLRKGLGLPDDAPLAPGQFQDFFDKVRAATGNDHDLLDMWWFSIPTLSEYAQSISRQFVFYLMNFLSDPGDPNEVSVAFPRRANIEVLSAMGVRFIVIDRIVSDARATLLLSESIDGAELYLYEIARPNLGNYSPTEVHVDSGLGALLANVESDPGILARRAFVEAPVAGPLTPARDVRLVFERSGVRITASSDGTSMLLLPLQFSHCLHASDPKVRVTRADLIFTLIQFNEHLDERLNWEFSFWRQSECRMKDVADLRKLGLVR
jgi:hypothetical protein